MLVGVRFKMSGFFFPPFSAFVAGFSAFVALPRHEAPRKGGNFSKSAISPKNSFFFFRRSDRRHAKSASGHVGLSFAHRHGSPWLPELDSTCQAGLRAGESDADAR